MSQYNPRINKQINNKKKYRESVSIWERKPFSGKYLFPSPFVQSAQTFAIVHYSLKHKVQKEIKENFIFDLLR